MSTVDLPGSSVVAGVLGVYDLAQGTPRFPPVRLGNPGKVVYSPTLRHIFVNGPYGWPDPMPGPLYELTVIDARTGLRHSGSGDMSYTFAMARDGGSIAAKVGRVVDLYDVGVEVSHYAVDADLSSVNLSPTGTPLVMVADNSSAVTVIAAFSGTLLARKPIPGTISAAVFTDGGQAFVAGGSNGVRLFSVVGERLWKVDTIGAVNVLAAAGPSGEWIAAAAGKTVHLLGSADGHSRWPSPNNHQQSVTHIAASYDGRWIATGCADRRTRVIDADLSHSLIVLSWGVEWYVPIRDLVLLNEPWGLT